MQLSGCLATKWTCCAGYWKSMWLVKIIDTGNSSIPATMTSSRPWCCTRKSINAIIWVSGKVFFKKWMFWKLITEHRHRSQSDRVDLDLWKEVFTAINVKTPKAHRATQVPIPPDAAVSVDLCDMDDILAAGYDDYHSTVSGYTDIDVFPAIGGPEAESLLDLDFGMSELHFDPAVAGGGEAELPARRQLRGGRSHGAGASLLRGQGLQGCFSVQHLPQHPARVVRRPQALALQLAPRLVMTWCWCSEFRSSTMQNSLARSGLDMDSLL